MYISLISVLSVVLIRFFLALFFYWSSGRTMGRAPRKDKDALYSTKAVKASSLSAAKQQQQQKQNLGSLNALPDLNMTTRSLPSKTRLGNPFKPMSRPTSMAVQPPPIARAPMVDTAQIESAPGILRTIMLVTCYSEGETSIRTTLDSLARTDFPDTHKMLFIIADGVITGSGNIKSTPDIVVDMIDLDPQFPQTPDAYSYVAIADGTKRHNMAKVYAGHYRVEGHNVPVVLVVKCGTPEEQTSKKPGNRGKRDSQVILMQFLNKVMFNDRMTPLEFDLFTKMTAICGPKGVPLDMQKTKVTPDMYELVLMVDADTKVMPDSLKPMSYAMYNDDRIIGLCGETQIANKWGSWVTTIQVFEYYLAHFSSKAFESVFGVVTCLPYVPDSRNVFGAHDS